MLIYYVIFKVSVYKIKNVNKCIRLAYLCYNTKETPDYFKI